MIKAPAVLAVMAKQPQAGYTKTRLCPPLTPQQAADLSAALLKDTLLMTARLPGIQPFVAYTPAAARPFFEQIAPPNTLLVEIEGANIGQCLNRVLTHLLKNGYKMAIALNADGPSLPPGYILQAMSLLEQADVVLGPGEDGGYYLVGIKQPIPRLFDDIAWSTEHVLAQSMARLQQLGLQAALTPPWYDVDTFPEVLRLAEELKHLPIRRLPNIRRFFCANPVETWRFP